MAAGRSCDHVLQFHPAAPSSDQFRRGDRALNSCDVVYTPIRSDASAVVALVVVTDALNGGVQLKERGLSSMWPRFGFTGRACNSLAISQIEIAVYELSANHGCAFCEYCDAGKQRCAW